MFKRLQLASFLRSGFWVAGALLLLVGGEIAGPTGRPTAAATCRASADPNSCSRHLSGDDDPRPASRERWGPEIERLLALDQRERYPPEAVLFVGSSSIRLWESIKDDVEPIIPIRRGFGGARSSDLAVFAPQLLAPHRYAALVIFVANDIPGEDDQVDHQPDQVVAWTAEVVDFSRRHQPHAPILLVEITPTIRRWHVWEQQRALNHRWRDFALTQPLVHFLPTAEYFLDSQCQVRGEYFVADQLHLNRAGYRLWGNLIRRRLQELLP